MIFSGTLLGLLKYFNFNLNYVDPPLTMESSTPAIWVYPDYTFVIVSVEIFFIIYGDYKNLWEAIIQISTLVPKVFTDLRWLCSFPAKIHRRLKFTVVTKALMSHQTQQCPFLWKGRWCLDFQLPLYHSPTLFSKALAFFFILNKVEWKIPLSLISVPLWIF